MIQRGDIVWTDFGEPRGSEPAKIRPSLILQEDWLIRSRITTILTVPLTRNLRRQISPGNVLIPAGITGLDSDSVAIVSQVGTVSREFFEPFPVGSLTGDYLRRVEDGIRLVMGL
ncbi:type II toxin-antitoxin system PemK/MazF family toxin [Nesterenkonia alkaliphila]|uniref:mRNA interferase n=1 Tax=Nesterenkonia alkaliphila TaxID=1463631 RepID=A0A7K1UK29_9MICC|nr:type II toxin-antitoxin system PemK/MazF family toxin [Nesterenkonia alkaliphila]